VAEFSPALLPGDDHEKHSCEVSYERMPTIAVHAASE
jgi:hypothetical protein